MKMAAAPSFPPFFPPVFRTVGGGGEGEERQCLCSEKANLYCGKSKNSQIYFFSTTSLSCKEFLVNGMTVSRISVFQYTFFSEAYGLLIFFNRFDTRARVKTISYGIENI